MKFIRCIVFFFGALAVCKPSQASCWPELIEPHNLLYDLYAEETVDFEVVEDVRRNLRKKLRGCAENTEFYFDMSHESVPVNAYLSLLDISIFANDAEQTKKFVDVFRSRGHETNERRNLQYGGDYLELGVLVEADRSVDTLLRLGFGPNKTNESGVTPLHLSSVRSDAGLEVTRNLASYGADVELATESGMTPMILAWLQGNLVKAQCLYALGARVPDEESLGSFSVDASFLDAAEKVEEFFQSVDKQISPEVEKICTLRRL